MTSAYASLSSSLSCADSLRRAFKRIGRMASAEALGGICVHCGCNLSIVDRPGICTVDGQQVRVKYPTCYVCFLLNSAPLGSRTTRIGAGLDLPANATQPSRLADLKRGTPR